MTRQIDGKFHIEATPGSVRILSVTGAEVPEDEPLFLLRARDWNALEALEAYQRECEKEGCTPYHLTGIAQALSAFGRFRKEHPERMKQPGITMGRREV